MQLHVKPGDRLIKGYYEALGQFGGLDVAHEMAVRSAFQNLLTGYSKKLDWALVPEYRIKVARAQSIVVDAAILDEFKFRHGFWEAKDEHDNLETEVKHKIERGYPTSNIIFQAPERAILYQRGARQDFNPDIRDAKNLADMLSHFFAYKEPDHEEWEEAAAEFWQHVPEVAGVLKRLIDDEHRKNREFRQRFDDFCALCRQAINPNLSAEAVEKMLIQHLLTERIFRRVFHNEEFRTRNAVAAEIEKVIRSLTSHHFSRDSFLSSLDRFYKAIERAADNKDDYSEKQAFLNTVYERFFQGYSPKEADTHGIVYTPQPIVDFMVRSVEDILKREFGKSLADRGVHILDPFVGTGNFIVRVMRQIAETRKSALREKYENELHCNEIMLLPYYIASMNIEHEYYEQMGEYRPFPGICLMDTFDLAEARALSGQLFTEANTDRVNKQKTTPIFVVIGNPPYSAWQVDASDNNQRRSYAELDSRISRTYAKDSSATNRTALFDTYVKAVRWATDRIGTEGIVCFVTNNSFVDELTFDGLRKHLAEDFSSIYVLDLGGNVRKNPKISGTSHNVFGIQVGVSVSMLVRRQGTSRPAVVHYHALNDFLLKEERYSFLEHAKGILGVDWEVVEPVKNVWLTAGLDSSFDTFLPVASKTGEAAGSGVIFRSHCRGVCTCRDAWVYNYDSSALASNMKLTVDAYNAEVYRWRTRTDQNARLDDFVLYDDTKISWSRDLKRDLKNGRLAEFEVFKIRESLYRPFTKTHLFLDRVLNQDVHHLPLFFPSSPGKNNCAIALTDVGGRVSFAALASELVVDMHACAASDVFQCFPFYVYGEDGSNRRENITDWALEAFRKRYNDAAITKWDIFHYVYGILHSPEYRTRYAANLKRELPRIPYAPDFRAFACAGQRLSELHVNYEKQPEYPLRRIENPKEHPGYRVEKMRLSKDKTKLTYNNFLTLDGIPPETYEYRLGNRSALEWVVDQYQVTTDKRSGITNDPNREDDPEYILRLLGQVIHVSLETVKVVASLPPLGIQQADSQVT